MKLSDIPFEPNVPFEKYQLAKDFLFNRRKDFVGTANYAILSKSLREVIQGACHYGIQNGHYDKGLRVAVASEIAINRRENSGLGFSKHPATETFLKYFLYDSPYSRFILNREDYDFCRDYGIILSANMNTKIMQNILIVSRHFREVKDDSFILFENFVNAGVNPDVAYAFSFNSGYGSSYNYNPIDTVLWSLGHRATSVFDVDSFRNLVSHKVGKVFLYENEDPSAPEFFYSKSTNYLGGSSLFAENAQRRYLGEDLFHRYPGYVRALKESRGEKVVEGYRPPNPFAAQRNPLNLPEWYLTYKELHDVALPFLLGILEETTAEKKVA